MAEHARDPEPRPTYFSQEPEPTVQMPVRSRWIPKPEQIIMLESIFNNGIVNPSKEETMRIRQLLEKYGQLADSNVFYWFQNRRSRYRRRQRQLRASHRTSSDVREQPQAQAEEIAGGGHTIQYSDYMSVSLEPNSMSHGTLNTGSPSYLVGSSSSSSVHINDTLNNSSDDFVSFLGPPAGLVQEYEQSPIICSTATSSLNYQPGKLLRNGMITVYINGVQTRIGRGPLNMKTMFDGDFVIYHSSGMPVQMNQNGIVMENLIHGESYFVVANS